MKTEHADYRTERLKLNVEPRYFVRFAHIHEHGAAADYPFSVDFSTDAVVGATKTKLAYIASVSVSPALVEAASGGIDGGGFDIDLVDIGGELLRYLSAPALTLKTAMTRTSPAPGGLVEINQPVNGLPTVGTIDILTRVLRAGGPRTALTSLIPAFIAPPAVAPGGAEDIFTGGLGAMDVGDYRYKYTWINAFGGQTTPSPESAAIPLTIAGLGIRVTGVAVGPAGTTKRRVYRTKVNATGPYYLVGEIEDNTATTFDDAMHDDQAVTLGEAPGGNTFPAAGNVPAGRHSYRVTFMDQLTGESEPSPKSAVILLRGATTVNLSAIPVGPAGTVARRLYRSEAGDEGPHLFLTELADNVTTVFVDTISDALLGVTIDPSPSQHVTLKECVRYDLVDQVARTVRVAANGRGVDGTFAIAHRAGDTVTNGEQIRPGTRVELFMGYALLDESKYMRWQKAEVVERFLLPDGVTWRVKCDDIQRSLRRELFVFASDDQPVKLKGNPFELALRVMTSTGFRRSNGSYDVLESQNGLAMPRVFVDTAAFVAMKDQLDAAVPQQPPPKPTAVVSGVAGGVDVGTHSYKYTWVDVDGRETLPSPASAVSTVAGSAKRVTVSNLRPGPAGTVKRKVYRTAAGNAAPWKRVRTLNDNTATSFVDTVPDADLSADAPTVGTFRSRLVFEFEITKPAQGKDWLEKEIFRPTNTYPIILQDGRISLRRYQPAPDPASVTETLTDDDLIDVALVPGDRMVINSVIVAWNFNLPSAPNQFGDRLMFTAEESKKRHGPRQSLIIESGGTRSDGDNEQAVLARWQERVDTVFKRFADPPVTVRCSVFYRRHTWEVGDCLKLTYALLPNLKFGVRGMTAEVFEIIHMRPFMGLGGRLELTLLHTGSISIPPPAARARVARLGRRGIAVAPPRPGGLRVIGQTIDQFTGRDIKITWRAVSIRSSDEDNLVAHPEFVQGYVIQVINPTTGAVVRRSAVADADQPEFSYSWERNVEDNGAAGLRSVRFSVRAKTMWGLEGQPAIITVSNPAPTMAAILPVATQRPGGLLLDWTAYAVTDTDFEKFEVLLDTVNPPVVVVATKSRKERKALVPDVPAGTTLYARVVPYDAYGAGTASAVATVNTTPSTPTGVTATPKPSGIRLKWTKIADPAFESVEVWRSLTNDVATAVLIGHGGRSSHWDSDEDLVDAATYYYWVRTGDTAGNVSPYHAGNTAGTPAVTSTVVGYARIGGATPFTGTAHLVRCAMIDPINNEVDLLAVDAGDLFWAETRLTGKQITGLTSKYAGDYALAACCYDEAATDMQIVTIDSVSGEIKYARLSKDGTNEQSPIAKFSIVGSSGLAAAYDHVNANGFYVVWGQLAGSNGTMRIAKLGPTGTVLLAETEVTSVLGKLYLAGGAAVDSGGNIHTLWNDAGSSSELVYAKISPAGALLVGPTIVGAEAALTTQQPIGMFVDAEDRVFPVAFQYDLGAAEGVQVKIARLTKGGEVRSPFTVLLSDPGSVAGMTLAHDRRDDSWVLLRTADLVVGTTALDAFRKING